MKYTPTDAEMEKLNRTYVYHPPKDDQQARYIALRDKARELAKLTLECCPPSDDRSSALRYIAQANMYANASIARNE